MTAPPTQLSQPSAHLALPRGPVRPAYESDLHGQRVLARRRAGWLLLAGAFLIAAGALLPWASVLTLGPTFGTDSDGGIIALGAAVLVAVLALVASQGGGRAWMCVLALTCGVVATAVGAFHLTQLSQQIAGPVPVSLGAGLPVLLGGSVLVSGGAFYGLVWGSRR